MHQNVTNFISSIKTKIPQYFSLGVVLECGSLDINGSNKQHFTKCVYNGIDIVAGKNVNHVTEVHNFLKDLKNIYDVVISTEMLEHDKHYVESIKSMHRLLKHNGLLIITAAGDGRKEHGTTRTSPADSPLTNDYYKNITVEMLQQGLNFSDFRWFTLNYQLQFGDIQFAGIKK